MFPVHILEMSPRRPILSAKSQGQSILLPIFTNFCQTPKIFLPQMYEMVEIGLNFASIGEKTSLLEKGLANSTREKFKE